MATVNRDLPLRHHSAYRGIFIHRGGASGGDSWVNPVHLQRAQANRFSISLPLPENMPCPRDAEAMRQLRDFENQEARVFPTFFSALRHVIEAFPDHLCYLPVYLCQVHIPDRGGLCDTMVQRVA